MDELSIKVNGVTHLVEVNADGNFYDKATKTFHAKTLAGLKRSMSAKLIPTGVPVQTLLGNKGKVIGRVGGKSWNRAYFAMVWDDNSTSTESGLALYPILSKEQQKEISQHDEEISFAEAELTSKRLRRNLYLASLCIDKQLNIAFPL